MVSVVLLPLDTIRSVPGADIVFEVLQLSDTWEGQEVFEAVSQHYNTWKGNKYFMHVPTVEQVKYNYKFFPSIVARREGSKEILGIATLKYHNNKEEGANPFCPTMDKHLEVTGIYTKANTGYRNIGAHLYATCIMSAHNYAQKHPGVKLSFEIDSRNEPSRKSCAKALNIINENQKVGAGNILTSNLNGYYIYQSQDNELIDPAILVFDIGLDPVPETMNKTSIETVLAFQRGDNPDNLLKENIATVQSTLGNYTDNAIIGYTEDLETVTYYPLNTNIDIQHLTIEPNGTHLGQDREVKAIGDEVICK